MTERVLIADGSQERELQPLTIALERSGFAVEQARDAGDVLARLRRRPPDAVLLEARLPGGALALLDELKTDPDLAAVPLVVLAEDLADPLVAEAVERGAVDCLRKPVDPAEAMLRVRAAMRTGELQRRLREGNDRLTELAATDDLTGLLSRRFLESHLRGLVAGAARHERPLAVAMLDIDGFKDVNDTHGHAIGDQVLCAVVERMRLRLRKEDLLGRWGGDEFLLVLPDVDLDGARTAAEGLRRAVAEIEVSVDGERLPVTLSAGTAAWSGESHHRLLDRADAALYDAKESGRNQVRADESVPAA